MELKIVFHFQAVVQNRDSDRPEDSIHIILDNLIGGKYRESVVDLERLHLQSKDKLVLHV